MKFNTPFNYDHTSDYVFEYVDEISDTVPEGALSIRELFERSARGLPLSVSSRPPVYDGEHYLDNEGVDDEEFSYFAQDRLDYDFADYERDRRELDGKFHRAQRYAESQKGKEEKAQPDPLPNGMSEADPKGAAEQKA